MTPTDVTIRSVDDQDADALAEVWNDARDYYSCIDPDGFIPPDPQDDGLGTWLLDVLRREATAEDRFVAVADLAGRATGFATAVIHDPVDHAPRQLDRIVGRRRAMLESLVVHRDHWRRGIGRQLLTAVEDWARTRSAEIVQLDTYAASPVSVPFYRAAGYQDRSLIFTRNLRGPS
jgi:GNAT superfamily N-acetyltransferase